MATTNSTTTLVVNPTAGRGRALKVLPQVVRTLVKGLPEGTLSVRQATSYQDAADICHQVVAQAGHQEEGRRDSLVVMGGDGMMHLGLNSTAQTDVPLGLIPAGTGNDFCRGLKIPLDPSLAAEVIVAGQTRQVDLASVTGQMVHGPHRWVGCVVSTGYDARVSRAGNALPAWLGSFAYTIAALSELRKFHPLPYRILIDGVPREQTAMFIAVGNSPICGGGMNLAPEGTPYDGLLDVTIIHPVSRLTLIRLLPQMFSGKFVRDPAVEIVQAAEVIVDGDDLIGMGDGEYLGQPPLHVKSVPGALTVYSLSGRGLAAWRSRRLGTK